MHLALGRAPRSEKLERASSLARCPDSGAATADCNRPAHSEYAPPLPAPFQHPVDVDPRRVRETVVSALLAAVAFADLTVGAPHIWHPVSGSRAP